MDHVEANLASFAVMAAAAEIGGVSGSGPVSVHDEQLVQVAPGHRPQDVQRLVGGEPVLESSTVALHRRHLHLLPQSAILEPCGTPCEAPDLRTPAGSEAVHRDVR